MAVNHLGESEAPKTYVDHRVEDRERYHSGPYYETYSSNDPRDREQFGKDAHHFIAPLINEIISQRKARVIFRQEQIKDLWNDRPKNLDYVVLQMYQPIDFAGDRYRFDNIFYNQRSFVRIVLDKQATKKLKEDVYYERYAGLVEEPDSDLVRQVADALMAQSEDQTTRILNAIALLNKKPVPGAHTAEQLKMATQEKKPEPAFQPVNDFKTAVPFYEVEHFLGLMSREYMVHKHPTLGFLIAL